MKKYFVYSGYKAETGDGNTPEGYQAFFKDGLFDESPAECPLAPSQVREGAKLNHQAQHRNNPEKVPGYAELSEGQIASNEKVFAENAASVAAAGLVPVPGGTGAVRGSMKKFQENLILAMERAHDLWAAENFKNGKAYGPVRDDRKKLHPMLVPFACLTEEETSWDKDYILGVVDRLLQSGFDIIVE